MKRKLTVPNTPRKKRYTKAIGYGSNVTFPKKMQVYGSSGELKHLDTSMSGTLDATGEVISSINLVPQGNTGVTRVGSKFVIKKINIRGYTGTSATAGGDFVRLLLVHDKQANKANPAVLDILETNSLMSFRNTSNKKRFTILRDWKVPLSSGGITTNFDANTRAYAKNYTFYEYNNNNCNIEIEYADANTDGAVTGLTSNNIVLVGIAQNDDATDFNFVARIKYTDK